MNRATETNHLVRGDRPSRPLACATASAVGQERRRDAREHKLLETHPSWESSTSKPSPDQDLDIRGN